MLNDNKAALWGRGALLWALMVRDFRGKYVASIMGIFWSVVNPLLLLAVFTFVFTAIFRIRLGTEPGFAHNALYIFCGVLPWIAFQESIQRSTTILIEQKNLVTRVRFPTGVLPASVVGSSLLGMLIGMCVLLAVVITVTGRMPLTALFIPILILFQAAFTLGLAWLTSSVNVFFRDLQQLVPVGLLVWMYGTPIFYSPSMVPERLNMGPFEINNVHLFLFLNPLHHLVACYRAVLLEGALPRLFNLSLLAVFCLTSLAVGGAVFSRGKKKFADVL